MRTPTARLASVTVAALLAGCGPTVRSISFETPLDAEEVERLTVPGRVSVETPTLKIESSCENCLWPDAGAAAEQFRADLLQLLGATNVSETPEGAAYVVRASLVLKERLRKNGLLALQIILPIALAVGSAYAAYAITPAPPPCPQDMFCIGQTDNRVTASTSAFALSYGLWNLAFWAIPGNTGDYRAEATVRIVDRRSGRIVLIDTVTVTLEDTFNMYGTKNKTARMMGKVLRRLAHKVARMILTPREPQLAPRPGPARRPAPPPASSATQPASQPAVAPVGAPAP